jgi:hypothetical protein
LLSISLLASRATEARELEPCLRPGIHYHLDGDSLNDRVEAGRSNKRPKARSRAALRIHAAIGYNELTTPNPSCYRGCALEAAYPVVPLADGHAVSVGMTTIGGRACFGVYADREALFDAGLLAGDIDSALSELSELLERASSELPPR